MSDVDVIVLFGASGDLAQKLLFPALYRLEERRVLDQRIVGVALDRWDAERFRAHVADAVAAAIEVIDPAVTDRLLGRLEYVAGDYGVADTFTRLGTVAGPQARCLHYLAIPPRMFEPVVEGLAKAGLIQRGRLLVEKPFGRDLASARELNTVLRGVLTEDAVYRIDHFLGKEPVENLIVFRYANPIFEPIWNRSHIDHIQITMAESFGVETRGALYETLGVVRDVVQNHLLQVVCLLTMEAPVTPSARSFADERVKVLRAIRTLTPADVVFGQYDGYRQTPHVALDSSVATFVALRARVDTPRWHGVPVYIRAGKAMATTATEATVVFRETPPLPFSTDSTAPEPNRVVFRIGPTDGVDVVVQTKLPGDGMHLTTTALAVDYEQVFTRIPLAYERVFHDALAGDRSQFAREDAVEEAWRIVADVTDPERPPEIYPVGSWGPVRSSSVLEAGRRWAEPRL